MLQNADKKRVAKSVAELGYRVTAADVSTATGLPVLIASQALNQIAAETGGHLAVSDGGHIVYSFRSGFAGAYIAQGLRRFIEKLAQETFKLSYFLLKISFGIMLIVSFSIVLMTFFILFFAQRGSSKKSSHKKAPETGEQFNQFLNYMILKDMFFYFRRQHSGPITYHYDRPTIRKREEDNFLFDCFSFLFGDGDPNEGLEEKRWQLIAKVIQYHDYVVTAEQLAPYTGAKPDDEDAVLPVLVRFSGKPELTESGKIVYSFPELATTAGYERLQAPPPYLSEFHWTFSQLSEQASRPIYLIAFMNLAGSWFLFLLLRSSHAPSITALFSTLVIYGSLFLLVPLARWYLIGIFNKGIDKRNQAREQSAELLQAAGPELKKKIAESKEFRLRNKLIHTSSIVYTTEMDNLDQDTELSRQFQAPAEQELIDARPDEIIDARPGD